MDENLSQIECFNQIKSAKENITIKDLCGKYSNSEQLTSFFEHVFSLSFKEEPKYNRLKELLKEFSSENLGSA